MLVERFSPMHRPTAKINWLETDFLATNDVTSLTMSRDEKRFSSHTTDLPTMLYLTIIAIINHWKILIALSHRRICSEEKVRAICTKHNLYEFCTFVINTLTSIYALHFTCMDPSIRCIIYISKCVFTLIDTRIRSISELYSGAGMQPAISICRRVCTHDRCVRERR